MPQRMPQRLPLESACGHACHNACHNACLRSRCGLTSALPCPPSHAPTRPFLPSWVPCRGCGAPGRGGGGKGGVGGLVVGDRGPGAPQARLQPDQPLLRVHPAAGAFAVLRNDGAQTALHVPPPPPSLSPDHLPLLAPLFLNGEGRTQVRRRLSDAASRARAEYMASLFSPLFSFSSLSPPAPPSPLPRDK